MNAQLDPIQWRCLNLPLIRPFSLSRVLGDHNFRMSFFLADSSLSQNHQCDVDKFVSFEFGHRKKSRIGTTAKIWIQKISTVLDQNTSVGNRSIDLSI